MANRIKGITVEIGGDTTRLTKALKNVDSSIKSTQSQLRDVNKLLKLDPGNTELLAQKHRLLGDAVGQTKQRLETLKTAAEQADKALAAGDISKEQYDALQREIVETEQELKKLETAANQSATAVQKIAAKGEKLKTLGNNISNVGQKMLPATIAITGLGTAAVKTAADFDSAMSEVAAVSGATGKDFDSLRAKAREMGAKTKFSATEAAQAMEFMGMAGWKTSDMLSGIEGIMNLAAASGEDLATTSDIVTDALTAFGLSADDSGHFADILAAASSNANTNVSMMGETFKYCAPIAGALGFSAEDTAEAIGLMGNAGIKSTQAGTALRSIMNNLSKDVKLTGNAFGSMTIKTTNQDGSMKSLNDILKECRKAFSQMSESEKAANAQALVGKNAMSGFLALMNAAPSDIEKLNTAITNCDGKAGDMAETMQNNLEGQITILKSQLQELAISFGDILMPAIRQIVSWIQGLVDKLNGMDEGTKKTIVTIGLIVAAIGPALIVIGSNMLSYSLDMITSILDIFIGIFTGNWEQVWEGVKGIFMAAWNFLVNNIKNILNVLKGIFEVFLSWFGISWDDLWNGVSEFFSNIWNGICTFFNGILNGIKTAAVTVWTAISTFFTTIWNTIKNTFMVVVNAIKTFLTTAWNAIKTVITTVMNAIHTVISTVWNTIKTVITTIVTGIQTFITNAWNTIKNAVTSVVNAIKGVISSVFNTIKTIITSIMDNIKNVLTNVWNVIKSLVSGDVNNIKSTVSTAFNNILSGIKNTMSNIFNAVKNGFSNVKDHITGLASQAFNWGKDMVMGIVNGIKSCIGAVGNAVSSVADKIRSFLHFSVPDEGPLTDYEKWMPDFMKGLAKGIEHSRGMIKSAMKNVSADMVVSPHAEVTAAASDGGVSQTDLTELITAIKGAFPKGGTMGGNGDIVIPVYVGGTMLDEIIVNAQQRANLRSGGR